MIDYRKTFTQVAKKILSGENRESQTISLAFVSKEEIRKLNKKFRKKNKPTDVLSFNFDERDYLGEIVICPEIVKSNARQYKITVKEEMMKMFVHGILHLCGYDHEKNKVEEKIMEDKQNFYLSNL